MKTKIFTLILVALLSLQLSAQNSFTAYGWKAGTYDTPLCQGPLSITIPDGDITSIECYEQEDYYFIHGGDWINNKWYGLIYDTFYGPCPLVIIDTETGAVDTIGYTEASITGLTHDYSTGITYIIGYSGFMGTINLETAEVTDLGPISIPGALSIACDSEGNMYALSGDDNLYKIDVESLTSEIVGPLGIDFAGETDLCFDRSTNTLYGLISGWALADKGLYEIDVNTGIATQLSQYPYNISGLAIPYDPTITTTHDLGVSAVTPAITEVNTAVNPTVTIENVGNTVENTFNIEFIISDGMMDVYTSAKTVSQTIQAGNELEITMDDAWTPEFEGIYTITATVTVNDDANTANNTFTATCDVTIDVKNHLADQIKIYPIPSNGILNVDIPEDLYLSVYDQTGRTVKSVHISSGSVIDLSNENKGLYLLNFINKEGKTFTKRVVIQ
ncbi:MAG: T9SS type A sorting domain-containing protein [Bacteroidales bacterium]|nr:T9SS type A sorting domain-containing protein [Bacteroidales bacterium]